MLSKSQISFVTSLHQKKFRKLEQLFIAEGEKVVQDLLASQFDVKTIFSTESFFTRNHSLKRNKDAEWKEVTEAELKKISALTTPHEVLAVAVIPSYDLNEKEVANSLNLVLDGISDPGNLGTIIRIADWFGIRNIICSPDTADCYNPKVVQASMGSLFRIKLHYEELNVFFEKNNSNARIPVYGTMLQGENIYSAELSSNGFILLGNESSGLRDELEKYCTRKVHIPSFSEVENEPSPDSLNVAVAAAIVCAEFRRRK